MIPSAVTAGAFALILGMLCASPATASYGRSSVAASSAGASQAAAVDPQDAALQEFQRRLNDYIKLRTDLAKKLKPLSPTSDAAELAARQEGLAAAIKAARKDAKRGDLIPVRVAGQIRTTVAADFRNRNQQARRGEVEEVSDGVVIGINRTYPAKAALPTVPPLLLAKLPILPDNLQYRFVNRHMVILDGDTQVVIDYIVNVLPPH
jgi:hypothetical protein